MFSSGGHEGFHVGFRACFGPVECTALSSVGCSTPTVPAQCSISTVAREPYSARDTGVHLSLYVKTLHVGDISVARGAWRELKL